MRLEGREGKKRVRAGEPAGGWGRLRYRVHSIYHHKLIPNSEAPLSPQQGGMDVPSLGSFFRECALLQRMVGGEPQEACVPADPTSGDMGPQGDPPRAERAQQAQAAIKAQQVSFSGHGLEGKASEGSHGDAEPSACKTGFLSQSHSTGASAVVNTTVLPQTLKHRITAISQQSPSRYILQRMEK